MKRQGRLGGGPRVLHAAVDEVHGRHLGVARVRVRDADLGGVEFQHLGGLAEGPPGSSLDPVVGKEAVQARKADEV